MRGDSSTEAIERVLQNHPDIEFAYVYGSRVKGVERPDSDLDVAVYVGEELSARDISRIALDLEDALRVEVDLSILNRADVIFQHQVLKHGRRAYVADEAALIRFEEDVFRRYQDYKPFFEEYNRIRRKATE